MAAEPQNAGLHQALKQRHMTLISIGGTIGAGLFVGSGVVINSTGPAALLSFLLAGVLVMLVMRMLGEMAVARPAVGSFYEYARVGLGNWAGFTVGWLYWYFWVVVVAVEAVAGAAVIGKWLPNAPLWLVALLLLAVMTTTNLVSVRAFGEFEYWFSSIKVAAIVVFIFLGALFVLGLWPHTSADVSNLTAHGGFAPHGAAAILSGAVPALASIAAAYISPDQVFKFLISSYGVVALFVYLLIAFAQVRLRRRLEQEEPEALTFKMWLFPWLSYATIAAMVGVILTMGVQPDTRDEFLLSLVVLAVLLVSYAVMSRVRAGREPTTPEPAVEVAASSGQPPRS